MVARERNARGRVVAIILGAGQGTRMGYQINKIFLPINGKPVIVYAIETFERCPQVDDVILVAAAGEEEQLAEVARAAQCIKVREVVRGGASRHDSERRALEVLRQRIDAGTIDIVLIHDGARPFISVTNVEQLIAKAREVGGAILAVPLQAEERFAQVDSERAVQQSFEGRGVWRAQTPQAFRADVLLKAYDQAERDHFMGTDTAASIERLGMSVAVVESDTTNVKITTAHDLLFAERLSKN